MAEILCVMVRGVNKIGAKIAANAGRIIGTDPKLLLALDSSSSDKERACPLTPRAHPVVGIPNNMNFLEFQQHLDISRLQREPPGDFACGVEECRGNCRSRQRVRCFRTSTPGADFGFVEDYDLDLRHLVHCENGITSPVAA